MPSPYIEFQSLPHESPLVDVTTEQDIKLHLIPSHLISSIHAHPYNPQPPNQSL